MMKNFKLKIEYDGTLYHGWQKQKNDRTIQGEIEKGLMTMTGQKIKLAGSGRTDAGVHSFGQIANFHCETNIDSKSFMKGINSLTSDDIVIKKCDQVDENFHARYDAKSKIYRYVFLNRRQPSALFRNYAWHIPYKLDIDAMRMALDCITGIHDFKAFQGKTDLEKDAVRTVYNASLEKKNKGYLFFEIEASGFLRYMVRNITGTLGDVGLRKKTPDDFKKILLSKNRNKAGATATAKGLFLIKVKY